MFNKIKKYWNKVVSIICAAIISFMTLHPCLSVAVLATGAGAVIGSILDWAGYVSSAAELLSPLFNNTPGSLIETKYLCAWMDIIKDSGLSEEDFRSYYTEIVTRSEEWSLDSDEYKTLLFIQDTAAAGVSLDAICYLAYHGTGTEDFTISEDNKPQVTGSGFKSVMTDYSLLYAPMPTPSQYLYNYQSATGKKETGYGFHQFNPYAPVFRYGKGYGADVGQASGWSNGCYILPYLFDDDLNGTYYSWGYWHFYHKTEDNIRYICADYISLADDSDVTHFEQAWNMSEKGASYGLATFANYFALCSYNSDTLYLQCSQSSLLQLSLGRDKFLALNGKITDLVSKSFTSFLQASTFTPQTNTADDWGYIISETPFELFMDQTAFDYNKIPDNYTITITGDTIYDYSITNPDTGKSTTINKYINNNYTIPSDDGGGDDPSNPDSPGSGGNVTVSGNVDVSGKIEIDTKPIDININVNGDSGYSGTGEVPAVKFDEDIGLKNYYDWMQDQTTGFSGFMGSFFSWLPGDIVLMLCAGFALVILARFLGR